MYLSLHSVKDAIHRANGISNISISRKILLKVKEAHSKSVVADQLRNDKLEQQTIREKAKDERKCLEEEHQQFDYRIRYLKCINFRDHLNKFSNIIV